MSFLLERYPDNKNPQPILTPRGDVEWEAKGVFNPTVVRDGEVFRMLYRTYPARLEHGEPRLKRPGFYFKNQISYIGYAESKDGINFERRDTPFITPDTEVDKYGCEDPRVTKIGDIFYITYTAIDGPISDRENKPNIRVALATTRDFKTITKHGIIGPASSSKAAAFFPELVNGGKIGLLLTNTADTAASRVSLRYYDSIEDAMRTDFKGWDTFLANDTPVLKTEWWLHRGPELGAAPIKTEKGWLIIFSAESMSDTWSISAALLDLDEPHKLIARTPGYILQPATKYERDGLVASVTFPEGAVVVGDQLYVYYGAADTVIALATGNLNELLEYLETCKRT